MIRNGIFFTPFTRFTLILDVRTNAERKVNITKNITDFSVYYFLSSAVNESEWIYFVEWITHHTVGGGGGWYSTLAFANKFSY